ncbi:chemotaxis protein [Mycobacterium sp. 1245852.3]|nr:chemotaxis protein [Mycobacterium sp. 1245852.3]
MSGRAGAADFAQWADTVLAGTGWTTATVREAAQRGRADLATAALADGFAAAARGLADASECRDGAA